MTPYYVTGARLLNANNSTDLLPALHLYGLQSDPARQTQVVRRIELNPEAAVELQAAYSDLNRDDDLVAPHTKVLLCAVLAYLFRSSGTGALSLAIEQYATAPFAAIAARLQVEIESDETFFSLINKAHAALGADPLYKSTADGAEPGARLLSTIRHTTFGASNDDGANLFTATLVATDNHRPSEVRLSFNAGTFTPELADFAKHHFTQLLYAAILTPDAKLEAIPIIGKDEHANITHATTGPIKQLPASSSVSERFADHVANAPDAEAVYDGEAHLTYKELAIRVEILATRLVGAGVSQGDRVLVCVGRHNDLLVSMLAVLHSGATYVPLDAKNPAKRIDAIAQSAGAKAIVLDPSTEGVIRDDSVPRLFVRREAESTDEKLEFSGWQPRAALSNLIYTSGSTGEPKGVAVKHSGLLNNLESMREIIGFSGRDRMLAVTTAAFDASVFELCLPIWCGGALRIVGDEARLDPAALIDIIEQEPGAFMFATPATWQMLIDHGWGGGQNLKAVCGGEAMSRQLADALLARAGTVWNIYGPTETTICSTVEPISPGSDPVSIGSPINNTRLYVLNTAMELVPTGVPGELHIGGAGVSNGYFGNDRLTQERFVSAPWNASEIVYRTGDIVSLRHDGKLAYVGRADHQIKLRGYRIEPGEIEAAIREYEGVNGAVVLMRGEDISHHYLEAYAATSEHLDLPDLLDHVRTRVPPYMVPASITCMPEFPLTANGKIDRQRLVEDHASLQAEVIDLPRSDLEVRVAQVWRRSFSRDVDRNANFFEQGGNSLMAVKFLEEIEDRIGCAVSFGAFYQAPTIAGLARTIEAGASTRAWTAPVRLNANTEAETPLYCISGVHLYQELGKALENVLPVYGVYVDEDHDMLTSLHRGKPVTLHDTATIAQRYLRAIQEHQSHGPYRLAGFSYGGTIAYELARQIESCGEQVEFLMLLDSPLIRAVERAKGRFSLAKHALRMAWYKFSFQVTGQLTSDQIRMLAADQYETSIGPYAGRVLLCSATEESIKRKERTASLGWENFSADLTVAACPGDHLGMISGANAAFLGQKIERFINLESD